MAAPVDPVIVGRIAAAHGVRGWVKVQSFTQPKDNILRYQPWWINTGGQWLALEVERHQFVQKGLLCRLKGIADRNAAECFYQLDIAVPRASLPALPPGEYYWYELQGLRVYSHWQGSAAVELGTVTELLATGANDVLVVKGSMSSLDQRERLIPYIAQVVDKVDLEQGRIEVIWDPEF